MRKRIHVVSFHMSTKEMDYLEKQVNISGLAREEFLRGLIMGAELRAKPCTHHADILHKIAGLCNNANQLAKIANSTGVATQRSLPAKTMAGISSPCDETAGVLKGSTGASAAARPDSIDEMLQIAEEIWQEVRERW